MPATGKAPPRHDCPGGCGKAIHTRQLACVPCWMRLPTDLRDAYRDAYANRTQDPITYKATRAAILAQLRHPEGVTP